MFKYFIEQLLFKMKKIEKITDCNQMTISKWSHPTYSPFSYYHRARFLSHDFIHRHKLTSRYQASVFGPSYLQII